MSAEKSCCDSLRDREARDGASNLHENVRVGVARDTRAPTDRECHGKKA
jgi:hypothetical protein